MASLTPNAVVALDVALLTVSGGRVEVALAPAAAAPLGAMALPGILLHDTESDAAGLVRLARNKLRGGHPGPFRRLGFAAAPRRDPRGRVVTLTHVGVVPMADRDAFEARTGHAFHEARLGPGGAEVRLGGRPVRLAYDHAGILADALAWLRAELPRGGVTRDLLGDAFRLGDLRSAYEAVYGRPIKVPLFAHHVRHKGLADEIVDRTVPTGGRPATLYAPPARPPVHWDPGEDRKARKP